jgi:hypothetical protein
MLALEIKSILEKIYFVKILLYYSRTIKVCVHMYTLKPY